ncbi:hypothetical protein [Rubritalea tangerina]|uniref:3-keto-disaccharide hydrolase domain-containing protein n=1 Tax=Rubritalea tangerina TaxID=430798 RepID=A0ABW4Z735_9BACT
MNKTHTCMLAALLLGSQVIASELSNIVLVKNGKGVGLEMGKHAQEREDGRLWLLKKKGASLEPVLSKGEVGRGNWISESRLQFHRRSDLYGKGTVSGAAFYFGDRAIVLDGGQDGEIVLKGADIDDKVLGKTSEYIKFKKPFSLKVARINGVLSVKVDNKLVARVDVKGDKGGEVGRVGFACDKSVMQVLDSNLRVQNYALNSK